MSQEKHLDFLEKKMIQKDDSVKNMNQLVPMNLTKSQWIYFYEYIE
jgi:hypothetical protein